MQNFKVIIDGDEYGNLSEAVDAVIEAIEDSYYDEWLDEMGDVTIGSLSYSATQQARF